MRVRTVKVTCVRMSEDDAFGRLGVVVASGETAAGTRTCGYVQVFNI
jgi:hypothetical protein